MNAVAHTASIQTAAARIEKAQAVKSILEPRLGIGDQTAAPPIEGLKLKRNRLLLRQHLR